MPREAILMEVRRFRAGGGHSWDRLREDLAHMFDVSLQAIEYRLAALGPPSTRLRRRGREGAFLQDRAAATRTAAPPERGRRHRATRAAAPPPLPRPRATRTSWDALSAGDS